MLLRTTQEVRQQNFLCSGPDYNLPSATTVLGFVTARFVKPYVPGSINLTRPHLTDLRRSARQKQLQLDHVGHNIGEMSQCGGNCFDVHRLNWLGLTRLRTTS